MTPGGYIILSCVLIGLVLQVVQMIRTDRSTKRIEGLEQRVMRIEEAVNTGQIDRVSVVAFRAQLASKFAEEMSPVHKHLREQDRKLDEIKTALKDWAEAQGK